MDNYLLKIKEIPLLVLTVIQGDACNHTCTREPQKAKGILLNLANIGKTLFSFCISLF